MRKSQGAFLFSLEFENIFTMRPQMGQRFSVEGIRSTFGSRALEHFLQLLPDPNLFAPLELLLSSYQVNLLGNQTSCRRLCQMEIQHRRLEFHQQISLRCRWVL